MIDPTAPEQCRGKLECPGSYFACNIYSPEPPFDEPLEVLDKRQRDAHFRTHSRETNRKRELGI